MCGISGVLDWDGVVRGGFAHPSGMVRAMRHRGPDAQGEWTSPDGRAWLGHDRLSIIDLSESGRQPLSNEDGTVWIAFNGEIYNFQSLRNELEGLGHRFRTRTDTEAIVHAYEQWGTDCVRRMRGMFAFAIWDIRAKRLFVARDRVGKKPLFYTQHGGRFYFASELQGLLSEPTLPREVNVEAIDDYLSWGYIPAPKTGFRNVHKLPPAHWLLVDLTPDGPVIKVDRYWQLDYSQKLKLTEQEACDALREKLTEAVRLRMISDVPLGAFLSGGIDSSIVVGLMAGLSDRPVKTFSIGFNESSFSELPHARRIAEKWGTEHHELIVEPNALEIVPMLARHYGEPYADSSAVPSYYVAKITRDSVTVALNGDGGDESFAGYDRYRAAYMAERLRRLPGAALGARMLAPLLPDSLDFRNPTRRLKRFLQAFDQSTSDRYARWLTFFRPSDKAALYSGDLARLAGAGAPESWYGRLFAETRSLHPVDACMAVDVQSYLPYDLLVKVDITSMATSLEGRSPFLDHEVMEFAAKLPVDLKLRGKTSKYLPKTAFQDLLPRENVYRPKMGFGVPVGDWFRGPLKDLVRDALLSDKAGQRGYFQQSELNRLLTEHQEGRADHAFRLWSLLMLEMWHREMVDRVPSRQAV